MELSGQKEITAESVQEELDRVDKNAKKDIETINYNAQAKRSTVHKAAAKQRTKLRRLLDVLKSE